MPTLPSGLPENVADGEAIVRFLTQSSHYNSTQPKPVAFLPNTANLETSVSRHGRTPLARLKQIGQVAAGPRTLHGAALFTALDVRSAALDVLADEPPDFHAVIRGWPSDADPALQKARQKEKAILIASAAELLVF